MEFLEVIERRWNLEEAPKGEVVHHFLVGTHPKYCRAGIMNHLKRQNLKYVRDLGFKKAIAEATGKYSQRNYEKLGFVCDIEIPYDGSYKTSDSQTPFEHYQNPDHPSCKGLSLELQKAANL
eukprot:gb/GECG01002353.1/.p1 GENE.gb/GECG01002353.1/~~gb/GECG01002353.1/.p1  ORF type:complete len:122 (+),score=17.29 gb/GECG01002353.1/:1-366(+)